MSKTSRLYEQIKQYLESCPMEGIDYKTDSDHLLACLFSIHQDAESDYESQLQAKDAEIERLQAQLEKAERVIGFYADKNNYYESAKTVKYNKITNLDLEVVFKKVEIGGKLAREYQAEKDKVWMK